MHLQPLFVLVAISFLLSAKFAPTLAQFAFEETTPIPTHDANEAQNPITQIFFRPPADEEPPPTRGAGSRNDRHCPQDASANSGDSAAIPVGLTALVPNNQGGLTWAERPTVWVYLPETSARQMVLSVREGSSQPHSQQFVSITGDPGVVGILLDGSTPVLEVGRAYQWAVVLVCGDRPNPNDPFVTAWVRRVVPAQPFNPPQNALERAAWYGEQGIWYDTLTALVEVRRSQPFEPGFTDIWVNFLTQPSVRLNAIANEPVQ